MKTIWVVTGIAVLALVAPAAAKDNDGRVERSGGCNGASTWKLKAKPDNGRLETEFEVDQNRNGVTWQVTLKRNGNVVKKAELVTKAPSGSFELRARLADGAGTDKITAIAKRDGERCRGSLTI